MTPLNPLDMPAGPGIPRPAAVKPEQEAGVLSLPVGTSLAEAERRLILATLKFCGGNKTRTAALLGISLKTLYNRLNAWKAGHPPDAGTLRDC